MTGGRQRTHRLAAVVASAFVVGACSGPLPGQPVGPMELTAVFEDVGNMRPGHVVKVADVIVGSIVDIDLTDGYRAEVTMSIDDIDLPRSTSAYVRTTSVLGEKFVELRPPLDVPSDTPILEDGDAIAEVGTAPEFEDLVFELGGVLAAVSGSDLASIIDEANTALDGRAGTLNGLLTDLSTVTRTFADQSDLVVQMIDALDTLASDATDGGRDVAELLGNLERATGLLAENRERLVVALDQLAQMAKTTNSAVFEPHTEAMTAQLGQLRRFIDEVEARQSDIRELLPHLGEFAANAEHVIQHDFINDYIIPNFSSQGGADKSGTADPGSGGGG